MKRVIIESPLKGDYALNRAYARACMRDSLARGESPFASHLLFDQPGILNDTIEHERDLGIRAGFAWGQCADLVAFYEDLGISDGMKRGLENARRLGLTIERRIGVKIPQLATTRPAELAVANARVQELEDAIRYVVTQTGDDLCWMDVFTKLGRLIGIEFEPKALPRNYMLANCELFIDSILKDKKYEPKY